MARTDETSCERVLDLLEAYVDGDLAPGEAADVQRHLAECVACAAELELALAVKEGLRGLPQPVCPPEVLAAVQQRGRAKVVPLRPRPSSPDPFSHREKGNRQKRGFARSWLRIAAAAAILAAIGSGLFFLLPSQPTAQTAEVEQATYEARLALAYLGEATRKAGISVREEVFEERVVSPTARTLSRVLPLAPEEP